MRTTRIRRGQRALHALYACLLAVCVTVGRRITFGGDVRDKIDVNYLEPLTAADGLVFLALAAAVYAALGLAFGRFDAIERRCMERGGPAHPARFACLCAALLALVWSPYILSVAPGNIYEDSLMSIGQMLRHGHPTSNNHPQFYTLMIGVFLKIGAVLFDSVNVGVLLYSLFQTGVMLLCITSVLTLLYCEGASRWVIGAAMAYYALAPLFPNYAMSMWKDPLFSCALVMMSLLLYLLWTREKAHWTWFAAYGVLALGAMMVRNSVPLMIAALAVLGAVTVRRHAKGLAAASALALAVLLAMSQAATTLWDTQTDFVESVGLPILQLGYTINHDGDFTQQEEEYLLELAPRDVWGYAYRPCLVDPLKWNPLFDAAHLSETKDEFFRVWLGGLLKNPIKYMNAYLLATHGFWKPFVQNWYGYMDVQMCANEYGIGWMDLFEKLVGFSILPILKDYPVFLGSGTLLWLVLFACLMTRRSGAGGLIVYAPALLNCAAVLLGTPVAYSLRYVFVLALGLPLFLMAPCMLAKRQEDGALRAS